MIVVIVAGGSGTRLWPISTPEYPKHLLKINGESRSLLQKTYDRAKKLSDRIYIVSEAGHIGHVKEQLPEVRESFFVVEPDRRGTASCIIAALSTVAKAKADKDEAIIFLWSDHYIRDVNGFVQSFKLAAKVSEKNSRIVLIGVEPDHPATGFGYIEKGDVLDSQSYVYNVKTFKEKPDYQTAKNYLKTGNYLWNCGYFVGSLNTFTTMMKKYAPELHTKFNKLESVSEAEYKKVYLGFNTEAIDYALIEKVPNLLVIPASFDWMDLGSFSDLHKAIGADEQGNYIHGSVEALEVENSFIQNHETKPLAVIGLDNVVVINTENGMLVARKDLAQMVGEVSKKLNK